MSFENIKLFEQRIAKFFGAPFAVAVDCCTHAIELCMRQQEVKHFTVPKRTYISVPFLASKLGIDFGWRTDGYSRPGACTENKNYKHQLTQQFCSQKRVRFVLRQFR